MELVLRDYQVEVMNSLREKIQQGHRAIMLYLPTGGGKTEVACSLLNATKQKSNKASMIMDRRVLCDQTSKRLDKYSIDHGVLMASHWRWRPEQHIQICSAQTLERMESFPASKLMVIDEAHCSRKSIIEYIENSDHVVIGLSASPFTKGLGNTYTAVVSGATTSQLVDNGTLCPLRVFIAKEIDMTGAKKVAGEWSDKEATQRGIQITGDVVSEWVKKTHEVFGEPRKTICFAAGVEHGKDLSRGFAEAGYNFVAISYKDDDEYKRQVFEEFARHDTSINGLIATDILTKGYDQPDVMIGISARPFTKSFSSHVQQMGRIMRSFLDKEFGLWLCHSGNYLRFRAEWDDLYYSGVDSLDERDVAQREPTNTEKEVAKCPKCGAAWPSRSDVCAACGHAHVGRNEIIAKAGEMEELKAGAVKEKFTMEFKSGFYASLLLYSQNKGYKEGWAYWKYKERFGVGPSGVKPEPSASMLGEVKNWVISQAIKKSKAPQ